jgi:hypothetical protein
MVGVGGGNQVDGRHFVAAAHTAACDQSVQGRCTQSPLGDLFQVGSHIVFSIKLDGLVERGTIDPGRAPGANP